MNTEFDATARLFNSNVRTVDRLLDFGNLIIDVAVGGLNELESQLEERNLHTAVTLVRNRAALLSNIRNGDSLKPQYQAMFNQCVVLLVSYFGSALHTLFRTGVATALSSGADVPVAEQELKVSWSVVVQSGDEPSAIFADLMIAQQDISFQDMQSVARAFKNYLQIELKRSADTDNIVLGQASRHVIAHAGGIVDEKMVRQVSGATLRTLKQQVAPFVAIQFEPSEVRLLAASMKTYIDTVAELLNAASSRWSPHAV